MKKWVWAPVALSILSGVHFYHDQQAPSPKTPIRGIAMLINHNLSMLPIELSSLKGVAEIEKEVAELKKQAGDIKEKDEKLNDKIASLLNKVEDEQKKVDDLNKKVVDIQKRYQDFQDLNKDFVKELKDDKDKLDLASADLKKIQDDLKKLRDKESERLALEVKRLEEDAKRKDQDLQKQKDDFEKRIAVLECQNKHQKETPVDQANKIYSQQSQLLEMLQQNQQMIQMLSLMISMNNPVNTNYSYNQLGMGAYGQMPFSMFDNMGSQYNNYGYGRNMNLYGQQQQPMIVINNGPQYGAWGQLAQQQLPMMQNQTATAIQQAQGFNFGQQQSPGQGVQWQQWQATPDNSNQLPHADLEHDLFNFGDSPVRVDNAFTNQTVA